MGIEITVDAVIANFPDEWVTNDDITSGTGRVVRGGFACKIAGVGSWWLHILLWLWLLLLALKQC